MDRSQGGKGGRGAITSQGPCRDTGFCWGTITGSSRAKTWMVCNRVSAGCVLAGMFDEHFILKGLFHCNSWNRALCLRSISVWNKCFQLKQSECWDSIDFDFEKKELKVAIHSLLALCLGTYWAEKGPDRGNPEEGFPGWGHSMC